MTHRIFRHANGNVFRTSPPTRAEWEDIQSRCRSGEPTKSIAESYGFFYRRVSRLLQHAGLKPQRNQPQGKLTPPEKDAVILAYDGGESCQHIAARLGLDHTSIWSIVRRRTRIRSASEAHRLYPLDESVFDTITEESAYWAGFIMADGCVHRGRQTVVRIGLSAVDSGHLEKFRAFMKTTRQLEIRERNEGRKGWSSNPTASITICSPKVADALAKYGIGERKSMAARVVGLEDDRHFWRGVVDGDGFLFWEQRKTGPYPHMGIVGAQELLEQFSAFVKKRVPQCRARVSPMHSIWACRTAGSYAVALAEILYGGCAVALDRKLAIAKELPGKFNPKRPPPSPRTST